MPVVFAIKPRHLPLSRSECLERRRGGEPNAIVANLEFSNTILELERLKYRRAKVVALCRRCETMDGHVEGVVGNLSRVFCCCSIKIASGVSAQAVERSRAEGIDRPGAA